MTPTREQELSDKNYELHVRLVETDAQVERVTIQRDGAYETLRDLHGKYKALGIRHNSIIDERDELEAEHAQLAADNARLILERDTLREERDTLEARVHELGNTAHIATFRVEILRDGLRPFVEAWAASVSHERPPGSAWLYVDDSAFVSAARIYALTGDDDASD